MQEISPRPEGEAVPQRPLLPTTHRVGPGEREVSGEGLPAEEHPRGAYGVEPEGGVPVPEAGGGRGGVRTRPRPGEGVEPRGVSGAVARPFGLEGEPSPEGLSPSETVRLSVKEGKDYRGAIPLETRSSISLALKGLESVASPTGRSTIISLFPWNRKSSMILY